MSVERLAETMTGIWASTFVPPAISIASFFHDVIVMPFTLRCGHAGRMTLPMPRSSNHLPVTEALASDFSDTLGFLQSLYGLFYATNRKTNYVRDLI